MTRIGLSLLLQSWGLVSVAYQRIRHQPRLVVVALMGVAVALGLVTSAGFFSEAVDQAMLRQELAEFTRVTRRPAFSTRVYLFPPADRPVSLEQAERSGQFVAQAIADSVGLPLQHLGVTVCTANFPLLASTGSQYAEQARELQQVALTYIADVWDHIAVSPEATLSDDSPSEEALAVLMHADLAQRMGVQVGDVFHIDPGAGQAPLPVTVVGLWRPRDVDDPFWFSDPDQRFRQTLLVRRSAYRQRLEAVTGVRTRYVTWHVILDEREIVPGQAKRYLAGFAAGLRTIQRYLPDARMITPQSPLEHFVQRQTSLTVRLLSINVPAFGLLLAFLFLTAAILTRWQRRETSVLISRGASSGEIALLAMLEQGLLFLPGLPLGILLGMGLARLMGRSASVLTLSGAANLPVSLRGLNPSLVALTLAVALFARVLPMVYYARRSVVVHERESARQQRAPFWYRHYLDLLLVVPTFYAYQQLGGIRLASLLQASPEDVYRDPLLILVPALFIFTAGLLLMRMFPIALWVLDHVADYLPWIVPYLALRQIGRQSHGYISPLLLIIVSLALGVYTLSMAYTLGQWMTDRLYYEAGADLAFTPFPLGGIGDPAAGADWIPPIEEFTKLPGVSDATPVGDYRAEVHVGELDEYDVRFVGIDRFSFPRVTWWRRDLAAEPLGALMNRLAMRRDGILVSERFLARSSLLIGDQVSVRIIPAPNATVDTTLTITGSYRYFPTFGYDSEVFVGNLEYLCDVAGVPLDHRVWLDLREGISGSMVLTALEGLGIEAVYTKDTVASLGEERLRLEQIGVLGTLSVGLLASEAMAIIGLLLYSYASLQERAYRFGIMRAIGLSLPQMAGEVITEYGMLTCYGAAVGAALGATAAGLFMPVFGMAGEGAALLPPILAVMPSTDIAWMTMGFAVVMILAELGVVASALPGLSQAVRLGDAAA